MAAVDGGDRPARALVGAGAAGDRDLGREAVARLGGAGDRAVLELEDAVADRLVLGREGALGGQRARGGARRILEGRGEDEAVAGRGPVALGTRRNVDELERRALAGLDELEGLLAAGLLGRARAGEQDDDGGRGSRSGNGEHGKALHGGPP